MKHKTAGLEGALLDAAVAKAEGYELDEDGFNRTVRDNGGAPTHWNPSANWRLGGPIIERERIAMRHLEGEPAEACVAPGSDSDTFVPRRASYATGPAPLIAAMRAYIASKFGEEVEL